MKVNLITQKLMGRGRTLDLSDVESDMSYLCLRQLIVDGWNVNFVQEEHTFHLFVFT